MGKIFSFAIVEIIFCKLQDLWTKQERGKIMSSEIEGLANPSQWRFGSNIEYFVEPNL